MKTKIINYDIKEMRIIWALLNFKNGIIWSGGVDPLKLSLSSLSQSQFPFFTQKWSSFGLNHLWLSSRNLPPFIPPLYSAICTFPWQVHFQPQNCFGFTYHLYSQQLLTLEPQIIFSWRSILSIAWNVRAHARSSYPLSPMVHIKQR